MDIPVVQELPPVEVGGPDHYYMLSELLLLLWEEDFESSYVKEVPRQGFNKPSLSVYC